LAGPVTYADVSVRLNSVKEVSIPAYYDRDGSAVVLTVSDD